MYAKHQITSVKALVQVYFPAYALSEHKQNRYQKVNCQKVVKFKMLSSCQKVFLWHIVYEKFQRVSVKALVQVDFPVHALSEHSQTLIEAKCQKMATFKTLSFCQNIFYGIKLFHANVQCVCIVYAKYQILSVNVVVGIYFLAHALSSTIQNYEGQ